MHSTVLTITLQTLACLLVIKGVISTSQSQSSCYKSNAILNCSHYTQPKPGNTPMQLTWLFKDKSTNKWTRLARIYVTGKQRLYKGKADKITLHSNGSLEIASLHPDDETIYQCRVQQGLGERTTYQIELRVACGKVTTIKREVCIEEDVLLECEAKHRTNPRKLKRVTWKKKTDTDNGSSYSLVASSKESTVEVDDGFMLHGNGSLLLRGGRDQSNDTYKCDVTKTDGSERETHFVRVTNVKCQNETPQPATMKTTKGRIAMTTRTPLKGTDVVMETSTRQPRQETATQTPNTGSSSKPEVLSTPGAMFCGDFLDKPEGTFKSPNFPGAYPANSRCKWTISAPQGYAAINITLDHVNIEYEDHCQHDNVIIHDELGNQVGCRLCGIHNFPVKIQVKGRVAVVVFQSDSSVNKSGFKINYKSVLTVEKSVL